MSLIVKVGKKGKQFLKKYILPPARHSISYTRRLERVKTGRRICAMTFDDGPMNLPASPDRFDGRCLTDVLLDILAEYGAKGTFDVIGDTGENYPDEAGKEGTAAWGGTRYDHYPDIHMDDRGGVAHNEALVRRMIDEGHQVTNHGWRHIIFGKKSVVYGKREYLGSLDRVMEDLKKLDGVMEERFGYRMTMHRPAHYVDMIGDGFTSYDVCDLLGYQYMAASYDGAGWLPSVLTDPEEALQAEINAMVEPMRKALEADPDFFCGQIIFQKDGVNMCRRTPVAFGLPLQLELLKEYGYQVVTVNELVAESPFADVGREDPLFDRLVKLAGERGIAYSDNTLRLDQPMTVEALAMLLCPKEESLARRHARIRAEGRRAEVCWGALDWCKEQGLICRQAKSSDPVSALPEGLFEPVSDFTRRSVYAAYRQR